MGLSLWGREAVGRPGAALGGRGVGRERGGEPRGGPHPCPTLCPAPFNWGSCGPTAEAGPSRCGAGPSRCGAELGGGSPWLPLLLLLLPGAVGLQCLSCGAEDGSCRGWHQRHLPPGQQRLRRGPWQPSPGVTAGSRWGGRGCSRGVGGASSRALPLGGLALFVQRRQCEEGRGCNRELPLGTDSALPLPADNGSSQAPNGLRCFGCPQEGPCQPTTIVSCYGDLRGCFHGNLSLSLGGATVWREVRGCTRDPTCRGERRGDEVVTLIGSCCGEDLCNRHLLGPAFFDPDWPRLELLPHGHAPHNASKAAAGPAPTPQGGAVGVNATPKMATSTAPAPQGRSGGGNATSKMAAGATHTPGGAHVTPKMAAGATPTPPRDLSGVSATPKLAAERGKADTLAAGLGRDATASDGDVTKGSGDVTEGGSDPKAAARDRTAAGRSAAGRPLEGKQGTKGPVGSSQSWAGPGWLLPFLLLLLL
ncbi:ly6/PLAUR domain-containing protein 3 [Melanerpes formicivorus]|uniref:ly6/PLAUR domain-containing protein 3 n=1 Tax=Melanerpes formicivorus TaxID=211600 RepID=UPI00358E1CB1